MRAAEIVIVGGGPSGISAALESTAHGAHVTVIERLDRVGGLARTIPFQGSRFDIGPHRFFTRNTEVRGLFADVLGDDVVRVARQTRIIHDGVYFDYPLTPINAMQGIGMRSGAAIAGSYVAARVRRALAPRAPETFEDWVVDRFGRTLFETFFRTYTEKVWGISCRQIGADWASQRIRGLSLTEAVRNALFKSGQPTAKTLVDEFSYPRLGAGQTYEKMADTVVEAGGRLLTGSTVTKIERQGARVRSVTVRSADGTETAVAGDTFLTSATLTDTIEMMDPPAPIGVLDAVRALNYRDHISANLLVRNATLFPDNWIYIHSKAVAAARIANYRNFSPEMAGSADVSPITVEYFATPGDALSSTTDAAIIALAIRELKALGLLGNEEIAGSFVVRSARAYPVFQIGYGQHVEIVRRWLSELENLLPIGRAGMFKYNNQDHAIATGLLAARTVLDIGRFDPWNVNIDAEYHEAGPAR